MIIDVVGNLRVGGYEADVVGAHHHIGDREGRVACIFLVGQLCICLRSFFLGINIISVNKNACRMSTCRIEAFILRNQRACKLCQICCILHFDICHQIAVLGQIVYIIHGIDPYHIPLRVALLCRNT